MQTNTETTPKNAAIPTFSGQTWLARLHWVGRILSQVEFEKRRLLIEIDQNC